MLYLRLVQGTQAYLAGRGLYHSYYAIINLQKYEDAAKKLAEWSSEADRQLHKTRTTQASGAVTVSLTTMPCHGSLPVHSHMRSRISRFLFHFYRRLFSSYSTLMSRPCCDSVYHQSYSLW